MFSPSELLTDNCELSLHNCIQYACALLILRERSIEISKPFFIKGSYLTKSATTVSFSSRVLGSSLPIEFEIKANSRYVMSIFLCTRERSAEKTIFN